MKALDELICLAMPYLINRSNEVESTEIEECMHISLCCVVHLILDRLLKMMIPSMLGPERVGLWTPASSPRPCAGETSDFLE